MPVTFEAGCVVFQDPAGHLPDLRYPLTHTQFVKDEIVAAVWTAPQIPQTDGLLAYFLYEGVAHPSRARYQYWAQAGHAGCLLSPRFRTRLGLTEPGQIAVKPHELMLSSPEAGPEAELDLFR